MRTVLLRLLVFFLTATGAVVSGCNQGSVGTEARATCYPEGACDDSMFAAGLKGAPADLTAGAQTYTATCASCHGADGKGRDQTRRIDFTSAVWQARFDDEQIAETIKRGRPPLMPPMALSEAQLRNIIGYLRSLKRASTSTNKPSGSGY